MHLGGQKWWLHSSPEPAGCTPAGAIAVPIEDWLPRARFDGAAFEGGSAAQHSEVAQALRDARTHFVHPRFKADFRNHAQQLALPAKRRVF